MILFWWFVAIALMAIGLIGCVVPALPGTTIILAAAALHRIMLGPQQGASWWTLGILAALTLVSYAIEFAAGYFGARRFGATRWGTFGAIVGGIVGLFFALPGLLIGPVIGAIAGELIAGKKLLNAGKIGWGTLLGNLAGMLGKLIIALAMIILFLMTTPAPW